MEQKLLTMGVVGTPLKENEHRRAFDPRQIPDIPEHLRRQMTFEAGYAVPFGMSDEQLADLTSGRVATREGILTGGFDIVVLPKVMPADLAMMPEGTIHWGWPHLVQNEDISFPFIERRLTAITWEGMFEWNGEVRGTHTFAANNEMAGYCGVIHAMGLHGSTGHYGPQLKAVVLSFGSVSRGAVHALQGLGFRDVVVYTSRPPFAVADKIPGVEYKQMAKDEASPAMFALTDDGERVPLIDVLKDVDVIVNGTLQNPLNPKMFVGEADAVQLKQGSIIIDISCDRGMGFWCAKPTSFEEPSFTVLDGKVMYYAVDHTPTYHWRSASWEISMAAIAFLEDVLRGPEAWLANDVLRHALEVRDGVILNVEILRFQNREAEYPHNKK